MFRQTLITILLTFSPALFLRAQSADKPVVFRSESTLVTVDVVVSAKSGSPARIDPTTWRILENGHEQHIASVESQSSATLASPKLLGTGWSNNLAQLPRSAASMGSTILLIDLLNTTPQTQMLARNYALRALQNLPGHERFVVFVLGVDLRQISGYSDDLREVQEALKKQPIQNLQLLDKDPISKGGFANPLTGTDPGNENIRDFERRVAVNATNQRVKRTLESLERIAEIVERQPGRKSLVWLTSSFPLSIAPEQANVAWTQQSSAQQTGPQGTGAVPTSSASRSSEFYGLEDFSHEVAKAAERLSKARVAVYPILVGTLTSGMDVSDNTPFAAMSSASIYDYNGTTDREAGISSARLTAELTGGRATFNSNDADGAFRRAVADTNDYYTLSFVPSDMKFDGKFHKIEVRTSQPGVELHYRPGYYATPGTADEPKHRLEQALSLDMQPSAGIETAARLKESKPPTLELRIATDQLSFERMPDGRREASLLVGYVVAPKNGDAAWRSLTPVEFMLTDAQFDDAAQRGLPVVLQPKPPSAAYLLRAGVLDLVSRRIGTVDVDTTKGATRVAASAPEPVPPVVDRQTLYPEMGRLTTGSYNNLFFNFTMPVPVASVTSRMRLPLPPQGSHALLALSFEGMSNFGKKETGSLLVFAEEPSFVKSTDPQQAAAEEAARDKDATAVWGPRDGRLLVCNAGANCTAIAFFERQGYLLKFVGESNDNNTLLDHIWQSLRSVHFSGSAPNRLPAKRELYTGPAIPSSFVDKALASPQQIEAGALDTRVYSNAALGLRYGFPADWSALREEDGLARFARLHAAPFDDAAREREHRFFQSCSRPLLHLRQNPAPAKDDQATDLTLLAITPACLGIEPPVWSDKESVGDFAAALSMLHDFGDVAKAHTQEISGRAFLTLEGQISYPLPETTLMQRRYQTVYLTADGEYLLAWMLTAPRPQPVNAFPAVLLEIGDTAGNTRAKQ
jgi:VWFA-related protein